MGTILSVKKLITRIQIENKIYHVVNEITFDLEAGKTLAIVGESGSGKTMTALSILRILPQPPALPSLGEVNFKGVNLLTLSEKRMRSVRGKQIAMIFQDPMSALNPVYTIGYQLLEVAAFHLGIYGDAAEMLAIKALEDVSISDPIQMLKSYPHQISGGMKQRAMIAMALMCSPEILIADEPTTALDVTVQAQILVLLKELQKKRKMSILLITHDMGVVAEMADDVIVMYATEQMEKGTVFDLFDRNAHPYTKGLFQSKADRSLKKERLHTIKGTVPSLTQLPSGCRFHTRCPYVMPVCKKGEVPYFPISNEYHTAKCWLYDNQLKDLHESIITSTKS